MIVRYIIKKLVIPIAILTTIFGSLQLTFVQRRLLNLSNIADFHVHFDETEGFFPFNFLIKGVQIDNKEMRIDVNRLDFSLGTRIFSIKNIGIDKINITQLTDAKLCPSDFKFLVPIVMQKVIKKAEIKEIRIGKEKITDVLLGYNRETDSSRLSFKSGVGKLSANWNFVEGKIQGNCGLNDYCVEGVFDSNTNKLKLRYVNITLDGTIGKKDFSGHLKFSSYKPYIKIWTESEFIKAKFTEKILGISGKIDYDLDKLVAHIHDVRIGTNVNVSPITIDKSLKAFDFSIFVKNGKIDVSGIDLSSEKFSLGKISIKDVDISILKILDGLKGKINGTAEHKRGAESLDFHIDNLEYMDVQIPRVNVSGKYSQDGINADTAFELLHKKQKFNIKAQLNNWMFDEKLKVECTAQGAFDLQDYKVASGQRIRGNIKYKMNAAGTVNNPDISGDVSLQNGIYVNIPSGTYIRDITLLGKLQKDMLNITKIYARDDSKIGGVVNGSGKIQYVNGKLNTNIGMKIERFKAVDQRWLNARLFGNLMLDGDLLKEVKVRGELYTEKPAIDISSIVMLSMRSTDLIAKKKPETQSVNSIKVKFPTDIKLSMKPELTVSGFGLQSVWEANAKVTGDLIAPKYEFTAKLKSGRIELTDNAFKLKGGDVLINNADTNISVSAEKVIDRIMIGAKFIQKAGQSKVNLYSNPYMPDNDIIAYMLFEKASSEISIGEAMALLSVMTKLSGGTDLNILGRMKTMFGIDTISIKKTKNSSGEEYDTVSLGKKIGKFKVSVEQAPGKNETNVVAEVDVAKNTKATVDLSSKDSLSGGILWSRRY